MQSELTAAQGSWLQQFHWDWFVTLTFKYPVSQGGVAHKVSEYLKKLQKHSYAAPYMAWVAERGALPRQPHIHAIVGNVAALPMRCYRPACRGCGVHLWRHGFAKVRRYDDDLRGVFYILKSIPRDDGEMEIEGMPVRPTRRQDASVA